MVWKPAAIANEDSRPATPSRVAAAFRALSFGFREAAQVSRAEHRLPRRRLQAGIYFAVSVHRGRQDGETTHEYSRCGGRSALPSEAYRHALRQCLRFDA